MSIDYDFPAKERVVYQSANKVDSHGICNGKYIIVPVTGTYKIKFKNSVKVEQVKAGEKIEITDVLMKDSCGIFYEELK